MALLLQSYQEKRELDLCKAGSLPTKTLGTQTSFIDRSSYIGVGVGENAASAHTTAGSSTVRVPNQSNPQSSVEQPNVGAHDDESVVPASEFDLEL